MKRVDIRDIYVCEILKQTEVTKIQDDNIILGHDPYYIWNYSKQSSYGLFTRTLGGYKHILTNTIYPKPSKKTGNKHVINPESIEKLTIREKDLCSLLISLNNSYYLDPTKIRHIEERINNEAKELDEDVQEL